MVKLSNRKCQLALISVALTTISQHSAYGADDALKTVATSKDQWTGIAATDNKRVFANYPRWSDTVTNSVAEIKKGGAITPYPDTELNSWKPNGKESKPQQHFVCVQALFADKANNLWIVDPASPKFQGVVPDGAKLIKVDLKTNQIARTYSFDDTAAPVKSYLNDVRVDSKRNHAYLTDSGLGAILVVDLTTGKAVRRLADHPSTKAEDIHLVINGVEFGKQPDGSYRKVHSDGIALSPDGAFLYYQALTGKSLYRVPVSDLVNEAVSETELGKKVELVATTCPADGIEFGADGKLYITSIEDNSVKCLDVSKPGNSLETAVKDNKLIWPDSLAKGPNGTMYVSASQINLGPKPATPYGIYQFKLRK